jgi:hypothetical protein
MSHQLTLELSDEAYAILEKKANAVGLQVSEWIITLLNQQDTTADRHISEDGISENEKAIASETALLSEQALATDWNKPEEDIAWSHLQPER